MLANSKTSVRISTLRQPVSALIPQCCMFGRELAKTQIYILWVYWGSNPRPVPIGYNFNRLTDEQSVD